MAKLNENNIHIHDEAVAFRPFCGLRMIDRTVTQKQNSDVHVKNPEEYRGYFPRLCTCGCKDDGSSIY